MILRPFMFECGPFEANLFLMGNETSGEAVMVDAGVFDASVPEFAAAAGFRVTAILVTHFHADHIGGLARYLETWNCEVYAPGPLAAAPRARLAAEGTPIRAAGFDFQVFQVGGHTPESVAYHCAAEGICFSGDALFAGAVGGCATDELHAEEIGHIRSKLLSLDPATEVYSGHGPATTISIEAAANPFLQPGFTRLP